LLEVYVVWFQIKLGFSENIVVKSVVDKYLEHSRIYVFENAGDKKVYISSADLMTRNIEKRVEVACPIYQEDLKKQILDTLEISDNDNVKTRIINNLSQNEFVTIQRIKLDHSGIPIHILKIS
jgi:polyphosphate kinase